MTTRQTLNYFLHRLPRIAFYIVLFYVIFFVGNRLFYQFAPPSYFLRYTSVDVAQDRALYEHEAVPVTFCREKRGNYPITGYRIFYKLGKDDNRGTAKQVANRPIANQITDSKCVDIRITPEQYDHTEGKYFFRTYITFKVNGVDKRVINESNTYLIERKPLTPNDIQVKILELEKEIQQLKLQLQALGVTTSPQSAPITVEGTTTTITPSQTQTVATEPTVTQPSAEPEPTGIHAVPVVGGVLRFLGL